MYLKDLEFFIPLEKLVNNLETGRDLMEPETFGLKYAKYYDAFYHDKNYELESDRIDAIIQKYSPGSTTLLELGCGTGNHSTHLARRYNLTSVDRSPHMLELAKGKRNADSIRFVLSDVTEIPDLQQTFDVCISMFHVLNYLKNRGEFKHVLNMTRSLLRSRGILIFDSWNGLAVLKDRPQTRVKDVRHGNKRIIRTVSPDLDVIQNICTNTYHVLVLEDNKLIDEYNENHRMLYLFPRDVVETLDECGFETSQLTSDTGAPLTEGDWSMQIVARPKR